MSTTTTASPTLLLTLHLLSIPPLLLAAGALLQCSVFQCPSFALTARLPAPPSTSASDDDKPDDEGKAQTTLDPATHALHQQRSFHRSGASIFPQVAVGSALCFCYLSYASSTTTTSSSASSAFVVFGRATSRAALYATAAASSAAIVPFTILVMLPVPNMRIIELEERATRVEQGKEKGWKPDADEVAGLIEEFASLNLWRVAMLSAGGVLALVAALG